MLVEPESMDDCAYFTRRAIDKGFVIAWVYRGDCPKCGKAKMGKPVDPKTKKPKIRAKEYECPACNYVMEKGDYEDTLMCDIQYTCPHCLFKGETSASFKRKKYQGVDSVVFTCEKCNEKVPITKKMK